MNQLVTSIAVIIGIIALVALLYYAFKHFNGYELVEDPEATKEWAEQIGHYRQYHVQQVIEHLFLWLNWQDDQCRHEFTTSPNDENLVRLVFDNNEIFMVFQWQSQHIDIQFLSYDDDQTLIVNRRTKISMRDNQIDYAQLQTFINECVDEIMADVSPDELIATVIEYAKTDESKIVIDEKMLYTSAHELQKFIMNNNIKDQKVIRAISFLLLYITKYHKADFIQYLTPKEKDE